MNREEIKRKFTVEAIFPVVVFALSASNLQIQIFGGSWPSAIVSVVGILGSILYFLGSKYYKALFYIWIFAQLIVIKTSVLVDADKEQWNIQPVIDLTQWLRITIGFSVEMSDYKLDIDLNVLALIFLGLMKILAISSLIGKKLTFYQFREDNRLGDVFPLSGTIVKRVNLAGEKDWIFVGLDYSFMYDGNDINGILVKNKNGELIKPGKDQQLVYLRLVYDISELSNVEMDSSKFPFIDWAICR